MNTPDEENFPITIENDGKMILFHGFSAQEITQLMKLIKTQSAEPQAIAFAKTTKHNLYSPLKNLITDVRADHTHLLKNPPQELHSPSSDPVTKE